MGKNTACDTQAMQHAMMKTTSDHTHTHTCTPHTYPSDQHYMKSAWVYIQRDMNHMSPCSRHIANTLALYMCMCAMDSDSMWWLR
jgi:hypothetical protein